MADLAWQVPLDEFGRSAYRRQVLNWLIDDLPRNVRSLDGPALHESMLFHKQQQSAARQITRRWRLSRFIVVITRIAVGTLVYVVIVRGLGDIVPGWLFNWLLFPAIIAVMLYAAHATRRIPGWMTEKRLVWSPTTNPGEVLDRAFVDEMKHTRALAAFRDELARRSRKP